MATAPRPPGARQRQAEEHHRDLWHHRPGQVSASGNASSGTRAVPQRQRPMTQRKEISGSPYIQDWRAEAAACALDQAHETRASLRPESHVISMGRAPTTRGRTLRSSMNTRLSGVRHAFGRRTARASQRNACGHNKQTKRVMASAARGPDRPSSSCCCFSVVALIFCLDVRSHPQDCFAPETMFMKHAGVPTLMYERVPANEEGRGGTEHDHLQHTHELLLYGYALKDRGAKPPGLTLRD